MGNEVFSLYQFNESVLFMKIDHISLKLEKRVIIFFAASLALLGIVFRYAGLDFVSIDMKGFLFNWYDAMAQNGFVSLQTPFSNYTPPYLYLLGFAAKTQYFLPKIISIKLISIFFDLLSAFVVYKILEVRHPRKEIALLGSAIFLLLPTIFLNSAYWGQADSIYVCFLLIFIYFTLRNQPLLSIIFFGIAFSFKAQSLFLSPFLLLLVIKKRIPWRYLAIIPLVYVAMMIPAVIAGRPFFELMTIYAEQAGSYHFLTLAAPNIYVFISNELYDPILTIGICIAAILIAAWIVVYSYKIEKFTPEIIIFSAFVSAAIVPFLLPKMHDRYFYLADALSLLVVFYIPKTWFFALGYQVTSGLAYSIFLLFPKAEPYKESILIIAAMINMALVGLSLYKQWDLISKDTPTKAPQNKLRKNISDYFSRKTLQIRPYLLFFLILSIGLAARLWDFRSLPPGLNPDEASIGIDSYYLYKYGIDRNGTSYPIHLISWGSGQNALYAYILLPLIALRGLNVETIRFPMLFSGILSMPLMYLAGKKMLGEEFGLLSMFLMAISPWHIVNSRWAVESNILPFVFLAGFTLMLFSTPKNAAFLLSCVFFSLCLYAYGTAYVAIPIFLLFSIPILFYAKRITGRQIIIGLSVFSLIAFPIAMFVIVNTFRLQTIQIGLITIPRLPVEARYESMAAIFNASPLSLLFENVKVLLNLLWSQEDSYASSHVAPFGYFYKITFPLIIAGIFTAIPFRKDDRENRVERFLLLAWGLAAISIGLVSSVNLTRINLIFTPFLFYLALLAFRLNKRIDHSLSITLFVLLVGFALFSKAYHGEEYQKRLQSGFNSGIIPAIEYAAKNNNGAPICFTESLSSAYIYMLYSQRPRPLEYAANKQWIYPSNYPSDPARSPRTLGKYHFQLSDCSADSQSEYILLLGESPNNYIDYKIKKFDKYQVYLPKK